MAKVTIAGVEHDAGGVLIPNEAIERLRERRGFVALPLLVHLCELEGNAVTKRQPHRIRGDLLMFCRDMGPRETKRAFEALAECEIIVFEQHGCEFVAAWVLDFDDWPVPVV